VGLATVSDAERNDRDGFVVVSIATAFTWQFHPHVQKDSGLFEEHGRRQPVFLELFLVILFILVLVLTRRAAPLIYVWPLQCSVDEQ